MSNEIRTNRMTNITLSVVSADQYSTGRSGSGHRTNEAQISFWHGCIRSRSLSQMVNMKAKRRNKPKQRANKLTALFNAGDTSVLLGKI